MYFEEFPRDLDCLPWSMDLNPWTDVSHGNDHGSILCLCHNCPPFCHNQIFCKVKEVRKNSHSMGLYAIVKTSPFSARYFRYDDSVWFPPWWSQREITLSGSFCPRFFHVKVNLEREGKLSFSGNERLEILQTWKIMHLKNRQKGFWRLDLSIDCDELSQK